MPTKPQKQKKTCEILLFSTVFTISLGQRFGNCNVSSRSRLNRSRIRILQKTVFLSVVQCTILCHHHHQQQQKQQAQYNYCMFSGCWRLHTV